MAVSGRSKSRRCVATDKPPRDVEEPGEVADGESQDVLSIQEVAKLLKVPISAIYAWNRPGVGPPFYKVGRKLLYRKSNARKWLAKHSSQYPPWPRKSTPGSTPAGLPRPVDKTK
ncbi:MAG: helix-turn-helix domain-containing protein [Propionibacteriaceae bacterium]